MTTCQSRSLFLKVSTACAGSGSVTGASSGWFELFQLPLDNHSSALSRTATLMWEGVGKMHSRTSALERTGAQANESAALSLSLRSCSVSSSLWSAVGLRVG